MISHPVYDDPVTAVACVQQNPDIIGKMPLIIHSKGPLAHRLCEPCKNV